jgi:hypothetical protein
MRNLAKQAGRSKKCEAKCCTKPIWKLKEKFDMKLSNFFL